MRSFPPQFTWLLACVALFFTLITTSSSLAGQYCCYNTTNFTQVCCPGQQYPNASASPACCNESVCLSQNMTLRCNESEKQGRKQIHIGAFLRYATADRNGYREAMLMAMEMINNRTDILPGYEIVLHIGDTIWGSGGKAIKVLFDWVYNPPTKVMLIGPATTKALEPVAEVAIQWNLVEIAYAAVSPKFSDPVKYSDLFRIVPSSRSFNMAKLAFMKHFNWKRIAIVHAYDADVFSPSVRELQILLKNENMSAFAVEGFQSDQKADVSFQLNKLKSLDARIIIGEFSRPGAQKVFCEAYKLKMYGPNYVWIVFGRLIPLHILYMHRNNVDCTREQLKEVIQGAFGVDQLNLRRDDAITESGLSAHEYWTTIKKRHGLTKEMASYAFDSVWSSALVLDSVVKTGELLPETFTYSSREHKMMFKRHMGQLKFEGISGPVGFDSSRERKGTVIIAQIRNESWKEIGEHFTETDELKLYPSEILWPDNRVPKDQMLRIDEHLLNPVTLIVVIWLLAVIGTFLSVAFLYFNIVYRENRSIKMSSPQLNNVIILGCILCYVSIILFGLDARFLSLEAYGINCNARTAVLSIGFSLAFGAMFSKTWRVHKIFTAAKSFKKMAIKDVHLFGIVAVLVVVDVVYLSLWFGNDPLRAKKLEFIVKEKTINDVIYVPVLYQCTCKYKTYFQAAMYAYKGILLLFGLFLAWETRNVTIAALNDSKYIGMSVYNVVTLSLIGAIVTTALDNTIHYEAPYAISSLCLIICTTATLLLVFVPKVYTFVMGADDQSFNTTTINNGVTTTMNRNQSHAFRFESDHGIKPTSFSTKSVQTDHHELTGSAVNTTFESASTNQTDSNVNKGYEIQMDDIELNDSSPIPTTRYNQQVTDNGLVTFMLTDM